MTHPLPDKNTTPYPDPFTLNINGVLVSAEALASILSTVFNPDPRRWYNFERISTSSPSNPNSPDLIQVTVHTDPKTTRNLASLYELFNDPDTDPEIFQVGRPNV